MTVLELETGTPVSREVEIALRRMLIHLQRKEKGGFEACRDIIDGLEKESKVKEVDRESLNCIASLGLDMREINLLEAGGFIYVSDLDGVDLFELRLPNMGKLERMRVRVVIEGARERLKEEKRRSAAEKIELTQGVDV